VTERYYAGWWRRRSQRHSRHKTLDMLKRYTSLRAEQIALKMERLALQLATARHSKSNSSQFSRNCACSGKCK
jgi:hypothetical protein